MEPDHGLALEPDHRLALKQAHLLALEHLRGPEVDDERRRELESPIEWIRKAGEEWR